MIETKKKSKWLIEQLIFEKKNTREKNHCFPPPPPPQNKQTNKQTKTEVSNKIRTHKKILLTHICQKIVSFQFSSVTQSCPSLCDSMNCCTPGLPVHHQLPEFTQIHVHWIGDAIQTSHPVVPFSSCPQSLPASGSFPMSHLFASGVQSIGVSASISVFSMNTQDWSPLGWTGWIFLQSKRLSRVFSNTIVQKHQFFGSQLSLQSNSHMHTWPQEKP